ncbi:LysR substrate-binding domain-containing protein [Paracoccaceae bacterium GXU_MW_L88]
MTMHPGIKLRHIRAFLDVAAEGTVTGAARRQGISQPALSKTISELETLLDQSLFTRQGRRLALSRAGEMFHRHALSAVDSLNAGAAALQGGAPAGRIAVGVLPTVATSFFPRAVLDFHALRPDCRVRVMTGPNAFLIDRLRARAIDFMVGRLPDGASMDGLSFSHLYEDDVVLCARAGHPMLGAPISEILRHAPLVLPPKGAIIRNIVGQFLHAQGLAGLQPAFETVSLAFGRSLLLQSDAVWFISRGVVAHEVDIGELVTIDTGAQFLSGAVGLTQLQSAEFEGDAALLIEILKGHASGARVKR